MGNRVKPKGSMYSLINPPENCTVLQRLAWPLAISLILHLSVLLLINHRHHNSYSPIRLTVNLMHIARALPEKIVHTESHAPVQKAHKRITASHDADKAPALAQTSEFKIPKPSGTLDTAAILKQVKDYTTQEDRTAPPMPDIYGEYYGTYDGYDKGTFSVHLDSTGHVLGSGQSNRLDAITFVIRGEVAANGLIRMISIGVVEGAQFTGKLDLRTRKFSGSWTWRDVSGSFSGQHE